MALQKFSPLQKFTFVLPPFWMREKTADFRVGQNSQFWKRDKIADFDNETKRPILKWDKIADS